jgi:hypothetical protein
MLAFDVLFPELAAKESRSFRPINNPSVPEDDYVLREFYCNERDCDCRRVLLMIASVARRKVVATVNYSFEPAKPPFDDEPQLFVDPLNPQSGLSHALKEVFEEMLDNDPEYRERLIRHYTMWKAVVDDPTHPEHPKVRHESHDDPSFRPAFPSQGTVRREGPKVSPNDPCPCGSGKKHKKCCRLLAAGSS